MDYIPAAVIAAHLRRELKNTFPAAGFTVRVRNFTSIDVDWTDGPTVAEVRPLTQGPTLTKGTWGEITTPAEPITVIGAKNIPYRGRSAVEHVFLNRTFSPAVLAQAQAAWCEATGREPGQDPDHRAVKIDGAWIAEGSVTWQINQIAEQIIAAGGRV